MHVDTSTVSPAITCELSEQYAGRGCFFLHAPVLGSIPQAADGTLLMFAGGDESAYEIVKPYLQLLAKQIWRFDLPEQATHMKLICNLFIAGMITTLGQALVLAEKANEIAQQLFVEAHHAGYGREDYSAVVKALRARGEK